MLFGSFTMPATSTSTTPTTTTFADETLPISPPTIPISPLDDLPLLNLTKTISISSGNPTIEETRGIMYLFDVSPNSPDELPVGRTPLLCVLGVPNHMTYADFCQFCGSFIQHMLEMRIVRSDGMEEQYNVLIRFDEQEATDAFCRHFNGRRFSSLEVEVCRVLFTIDVQYTGSIEHEPAPPVSSIEQPSCPVCLERLDQDMGGILTTICNHSFHCSCISKWTDSSCPVCRYCQQQPEKSICSVCETSENLWMCVICGFVGCGRYIEGHAIMHWKETEHCYSIEMETQRVWDYAGDNYVHRLIQSKTDGKLIELNSHCNHTDGNYGSCECYGDAVLNEYNELLTSQLDKQRLCLESRVIEYKEEIEREISEVVQKAVKLKVQKLQAKLNKSVKEKKFIDDINENLMKNEEIWKSKILEVEEREKKVLRLKDAKIHKLESQLKDLMTRLESDTSMDQQPTVSEIKNVEVLSVPPDSPSGKHATKSNYRRKG